MMSNAERAELYRGIRSILARHYVDLGMISILVTPYSARLAGRIQRLPGGGMGPITADIAEEIFGQIRRLHHMARLDLIPDKDVGSNLIP